jgi:cyclic pyranopterin phosphate synthase
MAGLGISTIKVTGGEALTRRYAVELIRQLKQIQGIRQVTLTSNGILLAEHLENLTSARLDALNISMDTLNSETFQRICRHNGFEQFLSVIKQIRELPFPVKINCVPIRGINDSEITAIAGLAQNSAAAVRFIELMPLGLAADFQMLTRKEVTAEIEKAYGLLSPFSDALGKGPAVYYNLNGFSGKIGFISPMSHNFCSTCNRLRLSAAGTLMNCLSSNTGLNVCALLRGSSSDDELAAAIKNFVMHKPLCHSFAGTEQKEMFRIGG